MSAQKANEQAMTAAGAGGFSVISEHEAGFSEVALLGDIDGDGRDDFALGEPSDVRAGEISDDGAGAVYVVYGKEDDAEVRTADLANGRGGFGLFGESPGDLFGSAVGRAGDLNGDGVGDLVASSFRRAEGGEEGRSGAVYALFGDGEGGFASPEEAARGENGYVIQLSESLAEDLFLFGEEVAGLGDVDGDGLDDLAIFALGADGSFENVTQFLISGKASGELVTVDRETPVLATGKFLSAYPFAGDLNGDGANDVVVTSPGGGEPPSVDVFFGSDDPSADFETVTFDPSFGSGPEGRFVADVAALGDVDGDGFGDLYVQTLQRENSSQPLETRGFVISGGPEFGRFDLDDVVQGIGGFEVADPAAFEAALEARGDRGGDGVISFPGERIGADVDGDGRIDRLEFAFANSQLDVEFGGPTPVFPEANNLPQPLLTGDGKNVIRIAFEGETSVSADTLGAYRLDEDGRISDVRIVFANANEDGSNGGPIGARKGDFVDLGVVPEGERVGLFVINNGFNPTLRALYSTPGTFEMRNPRTGEQASIFDFDRPQLVFVDGETGAEKIIRDEIFHTADASQETVDDNRLHEDGRGHVAHRIVENGDVLVGFEDRVDRPGARSDFDHDDLVLRISRIEPVSGFEVTGGDVSNFSFRSIGDVDGDGRDDFAVWLFSEITPGFGGVSVVYGKEDGEAVDLGDIDRGLGGFSVNVESSTIDNSIGVASLGDVDGGGADDFAIHGLAKNGIDGSYFVVYGEDARDGVDLAAFDQGFDDDGFRVDLGARNPFGASAIADVFTTPIDLNGDGFDDPVFGLGGGLAGVVFGSAADGDVTFGADDGRSLALSFEDGPPASIVDLVSAGDFDGDGIEDLAIGTKGDGPGLVGDARILFGSEDAASFSSPADFDQIRISATREGGPEGAGFTAIRPLDRDLNEDGLADLYLEASVPTDEGASSERAFVLFGSNDRQDVFLPDLASDRGFEVEDALRFEDVFADGDFDGDGVGDFLEPPQARFGFETLFEQSQEQGVLRRAFAPSKTADGDATFGADDGRSSAVFLENGPSASIVDLVSAGDFDRF